MVLDTGWIYRGTIFTPMELDIGWKSCPAIKMICLSYIAFIERGGGRYCNDIFTPGWEYRGWKYRITPAQAIWMPTILLPWPSPSAPKTPGPIAPLSWFLTCLYQTALSSQITLRIAAKLEMITVGIHIVTYTGLTMHIFIFFQYTTFIPWKYIRNFQTPQVKVSSFRYRIDKYTY